MKLKLLFLTVFFLISNLSFAKKVDLKSLKKLTIGTNTTPLNWSCITEFPTTSFVIETNANKVTLNVYHHNGPKYIPVYNGPITPNDIPLLETRGEIFSKMGDAFTIEFDLKECEKHGDWQYSCYTGNKLKIGNIEIGSAYISTTTAKEYVMGVELSKTVTTLSVLVDSFYHDISMDCYDKECSELNL